MCSPKGRQQSLVPEGVRVMLLCGFGNPIPRNLCWMPREQSLSHLKDIFMHGRGHPTMVRYFENLFNDQKNAAPKTAAAPVMNGHPSPTMNPIFSPRVPYQRISVITIMYATTESRPAAKLLANTICLHNSTPLFLTPAPRLPWATDSIRQKHTGSLQPLQPKQFNRYKSRRKTNAIKPLQAKIETMLHRSASNLVVTCEGVCVRVKNNNDVSADPKRANSPALVRLLSDYQDATEQYRVIVGYLKAAIEVLPKAECQLLLEFAEIAKNHCEQIHRDIGARLGAHRKSA
jgi:hypothetical protein